VGVLGKDVENRAWAPSPGQLKPGEWFAIHGGKWPTSEDDLLDLQSLAGDLARANVGKLPGGDATLLDVMKFSGIAIVCQFRGTVTRSDSPWFEGPIGWLLSSVVVLPEPVPIKGKQGLWELPDDVLAEVRRRYRIAVESKGVPDEGATIMSWTHLNDSTPVGREDYRCYLCGRAIPKGEKHVRRTGVDDDGLSSTRMHAACEARTRAYDEGDWECHDEIEFREAMEADRIAVESKGVPVG
jgi:hypothetical protein